MSKKGMYAVFEQHLAPNILYQKILARRARKKKMIYCSVVSVFFIVLFSGVFFAKSFFEREEDMLQTDDVVEDQIFINEYVEDDLYDIISDMDVKILPLSSSSFTTILLEGEIPDDLELQEVYRVYAKKNSEYEFHDMVECYAQGERKVTLAYSSLEKPLRDTKLSSGVMSIIEGIHVQIYKGEEKYIVQFQYNDVYYDIECDYLTEEEVLILIKSIIK